MNKRLERYTATLKVRLAKELQCYQQAGTTVTVTNIVISPDLKIAHVWLSVFGKSADQVFESIQQGRGEISKVIAAQNTAKFSPRIDFVRDEGQQDALKIEHLLDYNQN